MPDEYTSSYNVDGFLSTLEKARPGFLVAHSPEASLDSFHIDIEGSHQVLGRNQPCLPLKDTSVSAMHAVVMRVNGVTTIADPESKNGTFVDETRIASEPVLLRDQAVVRLSKTILVYRDNIAPYRFQKADPLFGMAGRFHAKRLVADIALGLKLRTGGILLAGPTGTGKELAARAVAKIQGRPLTIQNAARYTSEEEATSSLFGVKARVFSDVDERKGYIEAADGGVLFLDEAHALTRKAQRSLLRILEDGLLARIGEPSGRKVDVTFVFATNQPGPTYGLEPDFLARLTAISLLPLSKRREDIPDIFVHALKQAVSEPQRDRAVQEVNTSHCLALMSDGFEKDNVRGLIAVANRVAAAIDEGASPAEALASVFAGMPVDFKKAGASVRPAATTPAPPKRTPEQRLIESAYLQEKGNITLMQRKLRKQAVTMSRQRIAALVDEMGLKRVKKPRKG